MYNISNSHRCFHIIIVIIILIFGPYLSLNEKAIDVTKLTDIKILTGHSKNVYSVAWSPDGTKIVSGSQDGTIKIWNAITGVNIKTFTGQSDVYSVDWSPNGKDIVSGSRDGTIGIWNATTGVNLRIINATENVVRAVAWSPNSSYIVSSDATLLITVNEIHIWDATTGINLKTINNNDSIYSVDWSPNGSLIASGSQDKTIKIWNTTTGINLKTFTGHISEIWAVAWSPDGKKIASGSVDRTIKIWDIVTGTNLNTLTGHNDYVASVAWSPDGSKIVSGSWDKTIKIWNATSGLLLKTLDNNPSHINSVAWSPDGNKIASCAGKNITIWAEGFPNVFIKSLTVDKSIITLGESIIINATIENNGTADAKNVDIKFYEDSILLGINSMNVSRGDIEITQCKLIKPQLGKHLILAEAANSKKNITITVLGIPNVFVENITVNKLNITIGEALTIFALINNNGSANASQFAVIFNDGNNLIEIKYINISVYDKNSINCIWQTSNATSLGVHTLQVVAGLSMKKITVNVIGQPNIFIKDFFSDRYNISTGETINLTVILENNGTADAINIKVEFYDNTKFVAMKNLNVNRDNINITNIFWKTTNATTIGSHNLRIVIGKMEKELIILVNGIVDIHTKKIYVDKSNFTVGDNITITIIIENNGTSNATNILVKFYDGTSLIEMRNISISKNETKILIINWSTQKWKPGQHTIIVVIGSNIKTTNVNVKPLTTSVVDKGILVWIVFILYLIIILIIFIKNINSDKNVKK